MNIILDTDIGVDCDDAIALVLLLKMEKAGKCHIAGITTSTTREGATATIKTILNYYGAQKVVGRMYSPILQCDSLNNYAKEVKEKYGFKDCNKEGAALLLELLNTITESIIIVAIGPLTNLRNAMILKTPSGESGIDIINKKVKTIYCMGGKFCNSNFPIEWNIQQDISSSQYVIKNYKNKIIFSPMELGEKIFTGKVFKEKYHNPVHDCIKLFGEKNKETFSLEKFERESWDPITCYSAVFPDSDLLSLSASGIVEVLDDGKTLFHYDNSGKHFILLAKAKYEVLSKTIENWLQ